MASKSGAAGILGGALGISLALFSKLAGKFMEPKAPAAASLRIMTSTFDRPVPLAYGKVRLSANVMYYNGFMSYQSSSGSGGKGGGSTPGTYYQATVGFGCCEGPISNVSIIWDGSTVRRPLATFPANGGETISIYAGDAAQVANSYVSSRWPSQALNYRRLAYLLWTNYQMGSNPAISNINVEVNAQFQFGYGTNVGFTVSSISQSQGWGVFTIPGNTYAINDMVRFTTTGTLPAGIDPNHDYYVATVNAYGVNTITFAYLPLPFDGSMDGNSPVLCDISWSGTLTVNKYIADAVPSQILNDIWTDTYHGLGLSSGTLGDLTQWYNYCVANSFLLSPVYDSQETAASAIDRLMHQTNTACFFSEGVLKVVPYGDQTVTGNGVTYTPNVTPVYALTDDDFLPNGSGPPVTVKRSSSFTAYNKVQVTFSDRLNNYNSGVAEASDLANIEQFGVLNAPSVNAKDICDPTAARNLAQLLGQRALYIRKTYKFKLRKNYTLLEPMDIVTLTESTGVGLSAEPVRITSIEEGEDGTLSIEAEEFPGTVSSHVAYPHQLRGGYSVDYNISAGDVAVPVIFDAPGYDTTTGFELWVAVCGQSANWGGCYVYASTDNANFAQVGKVTAPSRYGVLSAAVAAGGDPDTVHTFSIDLTVSAGTLTAGSTTDADNHNTLCWVNGELISYSAATLTATNKYNLGTYVRRGVWGTINGAHSIGDSFVRCDDNIFRYPYDPSWIGKTIYLKFVSFNQYGGGLEDISVATAYPYTIQGPIGAPSDVAGFSVAIRTSDVLLSWNPDVDPFTAGYEIRLGSSWAVGTTVATLHKSTQLSLSPLNLVVGTYTWWIKAIDSSGRYSVDAVSVSLAITGPGAPVVSEVTIDNNVLLYWTVPASQLPIDHYIVTAANAPTTVNVNGLFASRIESAAGVFTYQVKAVDIAGNVGTAGSITANVLAPPDYGVFTDYNSTFSGTLASALMDTDGALVLPVNTSETFQAHFTSHSWSTIQDQINAGYPLFAEPNPASGSYTEVYDYGSSIPAATVGVTLTGTSVNSPTVNINIQTSPDNVTYTSIGNVNATQGSFFTATAFRYVKYIIAVTSGGTDFYRISKANLKINIKLKTDQGTATISANPTTINFNLTFSKLAGITVTPSGASASSQVAFNGYTGALNPTGFPVSLFNSTTGAAVTGTVQWVARGY